MIDIVMLVEMCKTCDNLHEFALFGKAFLLTKSQVRVSVGHRPTAYSSSPITMQIHTKKSRATGRG